VLWRLLKLSPISSTETNRHENCCSRFKYPFRSQRRSRNRRLQAININSSEERWTRLQSQRRRVAVRSSRDVRLQRSLSRGGETGIAVQDVKVEVTGTFGNLGEPARDISYRVQVHADATKATIDDLIRATDSLAEVQNTVRAGCAVRLEQA
jgi:hypothetical protein